MFTLTSAEIVDQGIMPDKYTLAGGNTSPPLSWGDAPQGTRSFALTMLDPDPPWGEFGLPSPGFLPGDLFVHWVVYEVPANVTDFAEGAGSGGALPSGAKQLNNNAREFGPEAPYYPHRMGYIGCAPPPGDRAHRCTFTLYALNTDSLVLSPDGSYTDFINAIKGKVLARSSLVVYFGTKAE